MVDALMKKSTPDRQSKTEEPIAVQVMIRLPVQLKREIAARADVNGRSMSSEIVAAIQAHLQGLDRLGQLETLVKQQQERIDILSALHEEVRRLRDQMAGSSDAPRLAAGQRRSP